MESTWRMMSLSERRLAQKLLSIPFHGRNELLEQLQTARVRAYADDGSLDVEVASSAAPAPVTQRVPVEGETRDVDDVPIEALIHVVDGRLVELEIVKADGTPIIKPLVPEDLTVRVRD